MESTRKTRWIQFAGIVLIAAALVGCESAAVQGRKTAGESPAADGTGPGPANPAVQLDAAVRGQVTEELAQALAEQYAYEDLGRKMAEAIRTPLKEGAYDGVRSPVEFADALQAVLRKIARDGHLGVRYEPKADAPVPEGPEPKVPAPRVAVRDEPGPAAPLPNDARPVAPGLAVPAPNTPEPNGPAPEAPLAPAPRMAGPDAAMLPDVRILDGNIGYMAVNALPPSESAKQAIAAAFALLNLNGALIFDLRGNTGGSPAIVGLIEGYLSDGPSYTTNTVHWRRPPRTSANRLCRRARLREPKTGLRAHPAHDVFCRRITQL